MGASIQSLGIDRLSVPERLQLVEEIWDGIAAAVEELEIPQSHKDELDRRIAALESDPNAGASWDEVKARLSRKPEDSA